VARTSPGRRRDRACWSPGTRRRLPAPATASRPAQRRGPFSRSRLVFRWSPGRLPVLTRESSAQPRVTCCTVAGHACPILAAFLRPNGWAAAALH
jgi:hypothetical protein